MLNVTLLRNRAGALWKRWLAEMRLHDQGFQSGASLTINQMVE